MSGPFNKTEVNTQTENILFWVVLLVGVGGGGCGLLEMAGKSNVLGNWSNRKNWLPFHQKEHRIWSPKICSY